MASLGPGSGSRSAARLAAGLLAGAATVAARSATACDGHVSDARLDRAAATQLPSPRSPARPSAPPPHPQQPPPAAGPAPRPPRLPAYRSCCTRAGGTTASQGHVQLPLAGADPRAQPGVEAREVTDATQRQLIADHFPWFLATYDGYPSYIQRRDAARYFIVYKHGGVYADLDYECTKPFAPVLRESAPCSRTSRAPTSRGAWSTPSSHRRRTTRCGRRSST